MADRTRRKRMRIFLGKIEVRNVELLEVRGISYTVHCCCLPELLRQVNCLHNPGHAYCGLLSRTEYSLLVSRGVLLYN